MDRRSAPLREIVSRDNDPYGGMEEMLECGHWSLEFHWPPISFPVEHMPKKRRCSLCVSPPPSAPREPK
jgi:hypothetical protein